MPPYKSFFYIVLYMPYRYRKGIRRTKRRKARPRRRNALANIGNRVGTDPFPPTYLARLTYVARFKVTPTVADTLTYHLFSCNGMFDPDITGSGHQPLGFDQLMALYNNYEVLGSKITVDAQLEPGATVTQSNVVVGIHVNDDTSIHGNSLDALLENGKTTYRQLTDQQMKTRMVYKWSEKKSLGAKIRGNSEVKGTAAVNPSEQQYYAIYTQANDSAVVGDPVQMTVRLTYFAKFTERKDTVQS